MIILGYTFLAKALLISTHKIRFLWKNTNHQHSSLISPLKFHIKTNFTDTCYMWLQSLPQVKYGNSPKISYTKVSDKMVCNKTV